MRILSTFQDYYDSAAAFGHDTHTVYARETKAYTGSLHDSSVRSALAQARLLEFAEFACNAVPGEFWLSDSSRNPHKALQASSGLVLFAGKLYPFFRVHEFDNAMSAMLRRPTRESVVYQPEQMHELAARLGLSEQMEKRLKRMPPKWLARTESFTELTVKAFFDLHGSTRFEEKAYASKVANAVVELDNVEWLRVNPKLKDYRFFTVLDAWQAFQEMDMFQGNIAAPERNTVNISDKDRIAQHGFDKWSFRKPPASNSP